METETILVNDLMTKNVLTVYAHSNVRNAIKMMADNNIGSVLVIDSEGPRGVFTERDLLSKVLARGRDGDNSLLMEVMSPAFPAIDSGATLAEAAKAMLEKKSRLMVFEGSELKGIVTATDIIRAIRHLSRRIDLAGVRTRNVVTESPEIPLSKVIADMDQKRIGSVLVGENDKRQYGIFTERDLLLKVLVKKVGLATVVGEFVTVPLTTAPLDIEGVDAAKIMATKHIKRLPLEDRHEIIGIVTARDIVEAFARSS